MSKQQMIGDVPGNVLGMFGDLCLKVKNGNITQRELELFLKRQNPFTTMEDLFSGKQNFYKEIGLEVDLSGIIIPEKKQGFDRLIVVASSLTLNCVYDECAKRFPCWRRTEDLDKAVTVNDRVPDKTYAVWCRDRIEADEELKNISADDLREKEISCLTLLERMVLELEYFIETGRHLDVSNITLCAGSRASDGFVPRACWRGGKFRVGWFCHGPAHDSLRARAVIS